MAIIQISRIQHRRGLQQDLPNLASAELGWSIDSQKLYIGNGTLTEGAPIEGRTEILTEHSDILDLFENYQFKGEPGGSTASPGINRKLQEKLDDFVNVRDFGAQGNGATDDTDAINRALEVASYSTTEDGIEMHRTVYFPAGIYAVRKEIKVPPFIKLVGDGKTNTVISLTPADQEVSTLLILVDSNGSSGINLGNKGTGAIDPQARDYIFVDIGFELNTIDTEINCLQISGGSDIAFERVSFSGSPEYTAGSSDAGSGHSLVNILANNSYQVPTSRIYFNACEFKHHNRAVEVAAQADNIFFDQCRFADLYEKYSLHEDAKEIVDRLPQVERVTTAQAIKVFGHIGSYHQSIGVIKPLSGTTGVIPGTISVSQYQNLKLDYVITRGSQKRSGSMTSTSNGQVYQYQDEYIESGDVDLDLSVNSQGSLIYTYSVGSNDAEISFTINYQH